jgi:hypothetical protein
MHRSHAKKGRPPGQHPQIDRGTKELQQKRQPFLLKGQDPALAESFLGHLYAHQVITQPLYEAGCFFGELGYHYKPCLGYAFRPRVRDMLLKRGDYISSRDCFLSEAEEEKRTKAWRHALEALRQAGQASYQVVLRAVFYDQDLYSQSPLPSFVKEIKPLRAGLSRLDLYFKGELKGIGGRPHDPALNPLQSTIFPPALKDPPPFLPPECRETEYRLR